ncbi:outer membrane protein assembly factor [Histidinibacterium aquaticum]|uniref:Outer membrane protein assembly factor n=1 Tax=Histidinibacterium aquaticum TaxID=2613962 RepID=A0A5J5GJE3_9RHOB|nr:outer membrane protein assembly factor [Histidinibacterium aquaticum]
MALGLSALPAAAQQIVLAAGDAGESLQEELRQASLIFALEEEEQPTAQDYVAAAQADYRRLQTALYNAGYYGGTVSIDIDGREAASIAPLGAPPSIQRIVVQVDRGPQFTFGRAVVTPLAEGTEMPEAFRSGERAFTAPIRRAVNAGLDGWRQQGRARAEVVGEDIVARHPQEELDVTVTLDPGPVLTFGPLIISGNEAVRTERIRQIAGLPTGQVYDPDEVETASNRLRRTDVFSSVVLREAEENGPNQTLPMLLDVAERQPRRFGFGVEVSSIDGLTASAFWLHRNLFGGAERFRVEGEVSQIGENLEAIDYSLTANFRRPATFGPDNDLFANLEFEDVQDDLIELRAVQAELGLSRLVTEDLTISGGVGYRYGEVVTELRDVTYQLLTLPLTLEFDRRDNELDAQNGYYADVTATPFLGLENADDGGRLYTDLRGYRSFGADDRFTFAGRLQYGAIIGASADSAPQDFLFYSGGGGTVRGQEYQSLGVMRDGAEVGGTSFLGAQLEARIGVRNNLEAVGFYDVGQVGSGEVPEPDDPYHAGAGLGIRYDTGIGPIRLDIATPVTGDDAYGSVQVYIGIGQAF